MMIPTLWSVFPSDRDLRPPPKALTTPNFSKPSDPPTLPHPSTTHENVELTTPLCCTRYAPSQADVAVFKALPSAPAAATYPHSARWYSHIQSYETEHATLPGDASAPATAYGPSSSAAPVENIAAVEAAAEDDEDEIDLFGSDKIGRAHV